MHIKLIKTRYKNRNILSATIVEARNLFVFLRMDKNTWIISVKRKSVYKKLYKNRYKLQPLFPTHSNRWAESLSVLCKSRKIIEKTIRTTEAATCSFFNHRRATKAMPHILRSLCRPTKPMFFPCIAVVGLRWLWKRSKNAFVGIRKELFWIDRSL